MLVVILGVGGAVGRRKAFSTVASHLTVAVLHYGCATAMYARPLRSRSLEEDKLVSLIYINLTPALHPAIYTLRAHGVQGALWRAVGPRTPGAAHQADVTLTLMPGGVSLLKSFSWMGNLMFRTIYDSPGLLDPIWRQQTRTPKSGSSLVLLFYGQLVRGISLRGVPTCAL